MASAQPVDIHVAVEITVDSVVSRVPLWTTTSGETSEWLDRFPLELAVLSDPAVDEPQRRERHVAHAFGLLARELAEDLPEGEEKGIAFGKLLEARDWAVRATRAAAAA